MCRRRQFALLVSVLLAVGARADDPALPPADVPPPPALPQILPAAYSQTIDWLRQPATPYTGTMNLFRYDFATDSTATLGGLVRGYYRNDQRIYWTGVEASYGAEGVFRPMIRSSQGGWTATALGEFFLNEPFGSSILSDPRRDLYRANFAVNTFEMFQLFGQLDYGDWSLRMGKSRTPFGNYESPSFSNALLDAPFIRTEVIQRTETGFFLHYQPGALSADVAFVNDNPNLATNSSPGIVGRLGITQPVFTLGASVKWHGGVSSEYQKRYNNVVGLDWAVHRGRFVLYGETTYDQYGFWRNFDAIGNPLNLGVRSLYHRDVYSGRDLAPLSGIGYYVAVGYHGEHWLVDTSFGSYFPQAIGVAAQDVPIHRGLLKVAYAFTPQFQIYAVGLVENVRPPDGVIPNDNPFAVLAGLQLTF
ncbi:MAG: hypothetical protein ACJ8F7_17550 [Gemmataceae bacterium]